MDGMTSERVDAGGVPNVARAFVRHVNPGREGARRPPRKRLAGFDTMERIAQWSRDDENTIGGGRSGSYWPPDVFSTGPWSTATAATAASTASATARRRKRAASEAEAEAEEMTYGVWEGELGGEDTPGITFCGCRWTPRAVATGGSLYGQTVRVGGGGGDGQRAGGGIGGGEEGGTQGVHNGRTVRGGGCGAAVGESRVAIVGAAGDEAADDLDSLVSTTVKINLGVYHGLELRVKVRSSQESSTRNKSSPIVKTRKFNNERPCVVFL